MRESLVRFRSLVHMYVNRKQYIKVREVCQLKSLLFCFSIWIEAEMFSVCLLWSVCRWSLQPRGKLKRRGGGERRYDGSSDRIYVCMCKSSMFLKTVTLSGADQEGGGERHTPGDPCRAGRAAADCRRFVNVFLLMKSTLQCTHILFMCQTAELLVQLSECVTSHQHWRVLTEWDSKLINKL